VWQNADTAIAASVEDSSFLSTLHKKNAQKKGSLVSAEYLP
jgi:hypothetical protein